MHSLFRRIIGAPGLRCFVLILLLSSFQCGGTCATTTNTITPPPRRDVPGRRIEITSGVIYVPSYFRTSTTAPVDLAFFFHGAAWVAEQNFYDARKNAILVSLNMKDYSSAFRDPNSFNNLLNTTLGALAREGVTTQPAGRLCLASFSGGGSAVREILAVEANSVRITDVVLADSLYAPRKTPDGNELDDAAMKPFITYARRAGAGNCVMLFSHLYPPEEKYRNNTTTLAANRLIDEASAQCKAEQALNSQHARMIYRADIGQLHIFGYAGMTNQDHFNHFYAIGDLFKLTSLSPAAAEAK